MDPMTVAGRTEVLIGPELPQPLLPPREERVSVVVMTQPAATTKAVEVASRLRSEGLAAEVIGLPDREEAKTLKVVADLYQSLADLGLTVHDTVMGVGGGSVTDVAGFVAGTWLRGVEAVHLPTTFLGAIDAAIGGKTGINLAGKNMIGVFWHPSRVIVDTTVLAALPPYLIREGMAEAYKSGLVGDVDLATLIEGAGLDSPIDEVVSRALSVKASLVERDPLDRAERAFLNFGHTIGHAIEYASTLSHGESVSLGMLAAAKVSEKRLGFEDGQRMESCLSGLGLPVTVEGLDRTRVIDLVGRDKKRDSSGVRMVLLKSVSEPVLERVDRGDIELALDAIGVRGG